MKFIKLIGALFLNVLIFYGLNTKVASAPPLGKFLNPTTGIWQNEMDETVNGEISINGLKETVSVHYDELLIPHVFAQNEEDLYRTQGYLTAKHRLWQMEFQTYAAAGRLSEIVGPDAIDYDRQQRRRGMVYGAEQALNKMQKDTETYKLVEAYRDGVNSYIGQLQTSDLPVEYKLLDYEPELWTTKKTALLLMYMTKMLAGYDSDLEYTNALRLFGKENFDLLFPDFFDVNDPVIPKDTDWSYIDIEMPEAPTEKMPLDSISETLDKPHPDNGSNNWAISGKKSATGNPILANDPHLGLNLPSIWLVMQLSTPNHNTMGATLPGALGVISGFNSNISWGVTNATRDVLDWYKIEFKDESRQTYRYNNRWREASLKIEEIKVRGGETFLDSVIYTHHGPVSYDRNFRYDENGRAGYAMKWIGHIGGNNQRTFMELNRATNYNDYTEALKHFIAPAQNFVFASKHGDIALWVQGLFPNKWKGQGKFLLDGSNPEHEWQSFIPMEFNAHTKNPERGFVSSANQHPVDESYPFYVFNDGYETYRNRVINEFLASKENITINDFKSLHNNNLNLKAAELLPYIFDHMEITSLNDEEKQIYSQIQAWDFKNEIDQVGPSIWDTWYDELYDMTWDEFDVEGTALDEPFNYQTIYLLKNRPEHRFMDILDTEKQENSRDLFLKSFKRAAQKLTNWKSKNGNYYWKDYKATYAGHLLQALPAFSRFDLPIGGGRSIVNATSENHGPSWRMIVEMSDPPRALGVYPGGQSGNPGSKYYDNMIDDWAAGNYYEMHFITNQIKDTKNMTTLTIKPSR